MLRSSAVDGSVAPASDTVLRFGSRVVSDRGPDALEPTVAVTVETTPSVHYRGSGPVESIELAGPRGRRWSFGERSRASS